MAGSWTPRERMVYSAAQLVRERGVASTGVRDVVEHADAPRGSFQHYFPGGKDQVVSEALGWAGDYAADWATRYVETAREPTPAGLFAHLAGQWRREFSRRGFDRGCPIMAAGAQTAAGDGVVADASRAAFARWHAAVAAALVAMGVGRPRSRRLATVMLSALEGAIMMARLERSQRPLRVVVAELSPLFDVPTAPPRR
jgi:AcrR family transcriptional regulator